MNKPKHLSKGDKVAIVSLSSGILGENFAKHELDLGVKRLNEFGLEPVFMPNSLKGIEFLKSHPEARAEDLKTAFADESIKMVLCAIGGDDTYRTLPFLMNDENFLSDVKNNPKIFLGYSDSTVNHLMFHKLGLNTFYGMALLTDFAEFEEEMLPYTKNSLGILFEPKSNYFIESSPIWYKDRTDFSPNEIGKPRTKTFEMHGYEILQGNKKVTGKLLGGCLESLDMLLIDNYENNPNKELVEIAKKYDIFPTLDDWTGKIMFIETSENKISADEYRRIIRKLKKFRIFHKISGLICGKPQDEVHYDEYKQILKEELFGIDIPVLFNVNIGHAYPHTILPYGAITEIDPNAKTLKIVSSTLSE